MAPPIQKTPDIFANVAILNPDTSQVTTQTGPVGGQQLKVIFDNAKNAATERLLKKPENQQLLGKYGDVNNVNSLLKEGNIGAANKSLEDMEKNARGKGQIDDANRIRALRENLDHINNASTMRELSDVCKKIDMGDGKSLFDVIAQAAQAYQVAADYFTGAEYGRLQNALLAPLEKMFEDEKEKKDAEKATEGYLKETDASGKSNAEKIMSGEISEEQAGKEIAGRITKATGVEEEGLDFDIAKIIENVKKAPAPKE